MGDEEDPRIEQLEEFINNTAKSPAEAATFLHDKLGGKDAQVLGAMCFDETFAKAHFLLAATLGGGAKLTEELIAAKETYKACFPTAEGQMMLLLALELYIVTQKRNGLKKMDDILRVLWDNDTVEQIVHEDVMDTWHKDEKALHKFYPDFQLEDAILARETGYKFIDWVQREEEEEEEDED